MKRYLFILLLFATSESMSQSSTIKSYAFRLAPHQDVKKSILDFAKLNKIKAGCILSAVGSLEQMNLRYANQSQGTKLVGHFEVVSLTGTFSDTSSHLHLSAADSTGRTLGGHLLDDNLVYTTLEVVIADLEHLEFGRENDPTYGYAELEVKLRSKDKK